MKQLLILSGKGGTGKTTVASALINLSNGKAFADCDVDAPNLHLVMNQLHTPQKTDFYGLSKANIDLKKCTHCGLCEKHCNFGAIHDLCVSEFECEGCAVCAEICPANAIEMRDYVSGEMMLYRDNEAIFSTAKLKMGSGNSGKLVTSVKQQLMQKASEDSLAIIDGSPGIGCPVIASISGVDYVLLVAEPTISGIHDMKRIIETAKHFGTNCVVCINKFDVNTTNTNKIEAYCGSISVPVVGRIPYDETAVMAVNRCQSVAEYPESPSGKAVATIWDEIKRRIVE